MYIHTYTYVCIYLFIYVCVYVHIYCIYVYVWNDRNKLELHHSVDKQYILTLCFPARLTKTLEKRREQGKIREEEVRLQACFGHKYYSVFMGLHPDK